MKKFLLSLIAVLCLAVGLTLAPVESEAAMYTFNMTGSWTNPVDADLAGGYLWGSSTAAGWANKRCYDPSLTPSPWVVTFGQIGSAQSLLPKTQTTVNFVSIPVDSVANPNGSFYFGLQPIDINGNMGAMPGTYFEVVYHVDTTGPGAYTGLNFSIINQVH
jgi:hypothetical protein